MLAIRMQRKGRSGHAQFRVIVQDSRFSPTSGRVVAYVGNYDPHTKAATLDTEKIGSYLDNGAQPSDRVARLLKKEGIKLPAWFQASAPKKRAIRHPDKRRSTRPAGAPVPSPAQTSPDKVSAGEPKAETTVEEPAAEGSVEPTTTEETSVETPSGEGKTAETGAPGEAEGPAPEAEAATEATPGTPEKPKAE